MVHTDTNAAMTKAIKIYFHDIVKSSKRNAPICCKLNNSIKYFTP